MGGVPSSPASSRARLTVDLGALAANYQTLQKRSAPAETGAVVKCDAYGLGVAPVAQALRKAGCETFFVAQADEGVALRASLSSDEAGATIYVFSGCLKGEEKLFLSNKLRPVLNSRPQIERWSALARSHGEAPPAAIHIDTGMSRLGLAAEDFEGLLAERDLLPSLNLTLVMSHLANGAEPTDPKNAQQAERFAALASTLPGVRASLANSAGVLLGEAYRFDLTRPGIALYGGGPFSDPHPDLRCVATVEAPVLQVRRVRAGEGVGYGGLFAPAQDTAVATVGAGYGDGFLRASGGSGQVWAAGALRPIVGRISMDSLALDLGPDGHNLLQEGDWVELLGPNAPVDVAAAAANTISYELLTHLGSRYERRYL